MKTECPYCLGTGVCLICESNGEYEEDIEYEEEYTCKTCEGTGICPMCKGEGFIKRKG